VKSLDQIINAHQEPETTWDLPSKPLDEKIREAAWRPHLCAGCGEWALTPQEHRMCLLYMPMTP